MTLRQRQPELVSGSQNQMLKQVQHDPKTRSTGICFGFSKSDAETNSA
ncbi:MAG: hypothetical protein V4547_08460 [Bacteroidota bacterium]